MMLYLPKIFYQYQYIILNQQDNKERELNIQKNIKISNRKE